MLDFSQKLTTLLKPCLKTLPQWNAKGALISESIDVRNESFKREIHAVLDRQLKAVRESNSSIDKLSIEKERLNDYIRKHHPSL